MSILDELVGLGLAEDAVPKWSVVNARAAWRDAAETGDVAPV